MLRIIAFPCLVVALSLLFAPSSLAKEEDKAQIKKDFEAWYAETNAEFEKSWAGIVAAEAAAMPLYEKGVKLAGEGKTKKAIKSLLEARSKLFNSASGRYVHVTKGLSFKIAIALAEIYEKQEDWARLKGETFFMDVARPWLSKEEEQKVFLYYASKEVFDVYRREEGKEGRDRMKSKERKRLHRITRYLLIGGGSVVFPEGDKLGDAWEEAADAARKTIDKDIYEDFGGQGDVEDHYQEMSASESNFPINGVVLVKNQEVTKATSKAVEIDLSESRLWPVNCKSTGKVLEVTSRGRFIYKQKCEFRAKEGGHKLIFKPVKGLKLKKGDVVSMYVPVKAVIKGKSVVKMGVPAMVHSSRKGKTQWLLGVKTKKPAFVKEDGDFHITIHDDAEAPPKVK